MHSRFYASPADGMRRSTVYLAYVALSLAVMAGLAVHAAVAHQTAAAWLQRNAALVSHYRLTDLSLFTEARYTRNPSMADLNTAFQDYPFSFEHFPSGSLVPVPATVRKNGR
jgi:hypothetical protein